MAAIDLPANAEWPAMKMPPLSPPPSCRDHLETRADDTAEVFARRLEVRLLRLYVDQAMTCIVM